MNKTIVLYDGHCRMCVGFTGWIRKLDNMQQFQLVPYQDTEFLKNYPALSPAEVEKQIHVISGGKIYRGADAMLEIWKKSGHWSNFLASVFQSVPFIFIARLIYKIVARYRRDLYPNAIRK
ncbi:thiol-disulfide oxidoreductase DCC family protein [Rubrolithibacter danxiaensis]|uniref:thiol-disulfide oxidoreductase DCC family protein n=1 Tax=Rubrolithibacter danxiaensis TaxID=3390805 RepID=UPI003BF82132